MKRLRPRLAGWLSPRLWNPQPAPPLSPEDFAKRWFVTVAAATGGMIGALAPNNDFLKPLLDAFAPTRILFTILMTLVSITLIGPVEEYIFRVSPASGEANSHVSAQPSQFESMLQRLSWRAAGRLGLVLLLIMQLNIIQNCLEEVVSAGNLASTFDMVFGSLAPAVVTYYWSAALQRCAASITRRSFWSAFLIGIILLFPANLAGSVPQIALIAAKSSNLSGSFVWVGGFIGAVFGSIIGTMASFGLPALAGGWVLDTERRRGEIAPARTIAELTLAIAAAKGVGMLVHLRLIAATGGQIPYVTDRLEVILMVGMFGWGAGLLVSGFPEILKRAGAAVQPIASNPQLPAADTKPAWPRPWWTAAGAAVILVGLNFIGINPDHAPVQATTEPATNPTGPAIPDPVKNPAPPRSTSSQQDLAILAAIGQQTKDSDEPFRPVSLPGGPSPPGFLARYEWHDRGNAWAAIDVFSSSEAADAYLAQIGGNPADAQVRLIGGAVAAKFVNAEKTTSAAGLDYVWTYRFAGYAHEDDSGRTSKLASIVHPPGSFFVASRLEPLSGDLTSATYELNSAANLALGEVDRLVDGLINEGLYVPWAVP